MERTGLAGLKVTGLSEGARRGPGERAELWEERTCVCGSGSQGDRRRKSGTRSHHIFSVSLWSEDSALRMLEKYGRTSSKRS